MSFNCPENIGEMSPTSKGRFCGSCQKDIVVFTEMSNHEIREQLKLTSGKICGIFKKRQVMNNSRVEIDSRFRMAFMLVFLLGMSSTDMLAQDTLTIAIPAGIPLASSYFVKGQVVDYDSMAVPFARVWVDLDSVNGVQNRIFVKTDLDGNFRLLIPKVVKTPINLYTVALGYDTSVVQGITFEPFKNDVEVLVTLSEGFELHWVGIITSPPYIPKDPYEIGKTTLDGEDIRQWD